MFKQFAEKQYVPVFVIFDKFEFMFAVNVANVHYLFTYSYYV